MTVAAAASGVATHALASMAFLAAAPTPGVPLDDVPRRLLVATGLGYAAAIGAAVVAHHVSPEARGGAIGALVAGLARDAYAVVQLRR